MRASLADSLASRHVQDVQYVKGSVVLCCACLKPLYVLTRSLFSGDKVGRSCDAFRPVTLRDLADLETRIDLPTVTVLIRHWTPDERKAHCAAIPDPKTGQPALCPACGVSWVRVRALEAAEVHDRAYVWELVTLLPADPVPDQVYRQWAQ